MEKQEIAELIREVLKAHNYGIKIPDNFDSNESLFARGVIDSFGLVVFINALQAKFNLKVENREVHPGNFETIENITVFISNKKGGTE
jgi:acyl carrier protein